MWTHCKDFSVNSWCFHSILIYADSQNTSYLSILTLYLSFFIQWLYQEQSFISPTFIILNGGSCSVQHYCKNGSSIVDVTLTVSWHCCTIVISLFSLWLLFQALWRQCAGLSLQWSTSCSYTRGAYSWPRACGWVTGRERERSAAVIAAQIKPEWQHVKAGKHTKDRNKCPGKKNT